MLPLIMETIFTITPIVQYKQKNKIIVQNIVEPPHSEKANQY